MRVGRKAVFTMKKKIPKFENEDQESEFWATHDSTEYVDWEEAKRIRFPNLKPSTKTSSAVITHATISETAKDAEDLAAFEERAHEPNLPLEDVLKDLKHRGKI